MTRDLRHSAAQSGLLLRLILALALALTLAPNISAQTDAAAKRAAAKAQFDRAERDRTALEGEPQKSRTLQEYQRVLNAYRRVYLITPRAAEATPALLAEGELYEQMGRQFDAKYFQAAIDAYRFLLREYPENRYRQDALFTIGKIQKDDLNQLELAQKTFESFLEQHPQSSRAEEAREALKTITAEQAQQRKPAVSTEQSGARDAQEKFPQVTRIRTWNTPDYTRIVIDMDEAVRFDSARIADPDRIYFDLHQARLNPTLAGKTLVVEGGFLKGIRVAQNQSGVVRVVLDVTEVKDYSAFLLANPYRLIVDVYGLASVARAKTKKTPSASTKTDQTEAAEETSSPPKSDPPTNARTGAPPSDSTKNEAGSSKTPAPGSPRSTRTATAEPPPVPQPTKNGERSLTRALGLKIGRIVIDPGHGGHDTGTIGPTGLMEKDLCLDVALRLGKLFQQKLPGAEVIYTRQDDTFVPLEDRTAMANKAQADLFVSIHANSSPDHKARGVETYYLNFATSQDALEVAARENAQAQSGVHDLQDLVKRIARNEKIEESRELAGDIQDALLKRLQRQSLSLKNRGVRKAPFVVLIGANMPSVLTEISFISNPSDEQLLKRPDGRERVAEGIYRGVESYLKSLNSVSYNQPKSSFGSR